MLKQKQKGEVETCPATVSSSLLQNKHRHELAEFEKTIEDELKKHDMKLLLEVSWLICSFWGTEIYAFCFYV